MRPRLGQGMTLTLSQGTTNGLNQRKLTEGFRFTSKETHSISYLAAQIYEIVVLARFLTPWFSRIFHLLHAALRVASGCCALLLRVPRFDSILGLTYGVPLCTTIGIVTLKGVNLSNATFRTKIAFLNHDYNFIRFFI